jgi:flagellar basal-body rod modification protein FlgD
MPTTITPTTNPTTAAAASTVAANGLSAISGNDFMNILVKQLQMQDPFKPMTNEEMVQQLSTIRELEMNTKMSSKIEQLTDQQRFGSAAALIGKKVHGTVKDANGNAFEMDGLVTGISFTEKGEVMLELDSGQTMPLTALQNVTNPPTGTTAAATGNTAATNTTARPILGKNGIIARLLNL